VAADPDRDVTVVVRESGRRSRCAPACAAPRSSHRRRSVNVDMTSSPIVLMTVPPLASVASRMISRHGRPSDAPSIAELLIELRAAHHVGEQYRDFELPYPWLPSQEAISGGFSRIIRPKPRRHANCALYPCSSRNPTLTSRRRCRRPTPDPAPRSPCSVNSPFASPSSSSPSQYTPCLRVTGLVAAARAAPACVHRRHS
jgi:hypothetical protein